MAGTATVNGVAGSRFVLDVTDDGKNDTFHLVVTGADGTAVYDSAVQRVQGQVKIHD